MHVGFLKGLIFFLGIFPTVPAGNPYDTNKPEDQYHVIATETGNKNLMVY